MDIAHNNLRRKYEVYIITWGVGDLGGWGDLWILPIPYLHLHRYP